MYSRVMNTIYRGRRGATVVTFEVQRSRGEDDDGVMKNPHKEFMW